MNDHPADDEQQGETGADLAEPGREFVVTKIAGQETPGAKSSHPTCDGNKARLAEPTGGADRRFRMLSMPSFRWRVGGQKSGSIRRA